MEESFGSKAVRKLSASVLGRQTGTGQPFTLPHIRVDLSTGECEERENICPRAEDIARLNEVRPSWLHLPELCSRASLAFICPGDS